MNDLDRSLEDDEDYYSLTREARKKSAQKEMQKDPEESKAEEEEKEVIRLKYEAYSNILEGEDKNKEENEKSSSGETMNVALQRVIREKRAGGTTLQGPGFEPKEEVLARRQRTRESLNAKKIDQINDRMKMEEDSVPCKDGLEAPIVASREVNEPNTNPNGIKGPKTIATTPEDLFYLQKAVRAIKYEENQDPDDGIFFSTSTIYSYYLSIDGILHKIEVIFTKLSNKLVIRLDGKVLFLKEEQGFFDTLMDDSTHLVPIHLQGVEIMVSKTPYEILVFVSGIAFAELLKKDKQQKEREKQQTDMANIQRAREFFNSIENAPAPAKGIKQCSNSDDEDFFSDAAPADPVKPLGNINLYGFIDYGKKTPFDNLEDQLTQALLLNKKDSPNPREMFLNPESN